MHEVDTLMGVILPYANFFIFLGLAIYFFRKPARAGAAKKKEDYDRLVNEAKKAYEDASAKLAVLSERHAKLDQEVREIQSLAKVSADAEATKIIGDAERLAEHLKAEAKRIAAAEVDKAKQALRDEILASVKATVIEKFKADLNPAAQQELVKKRISELKSIQVIG